MVSPGQYKPFKQRIEHINILVPWSKIQIIPLHITKAYGELEALVNRFLTSTLYGSKWSASKSGVLTREEKSSRCPLDSRRCGSHSPSWHLRKRDIFCPSPVVNVPTTIPSFRVCYAVLAIFISDLTTSHSGQTWLHHKRMPWRKSGISQTQKK